ncbi:MAG: hypothetical protein KGL95_00375, partial [Patescibacteria group bacterium]|nr:hypothetical protein [Patescibacteria group bacterium]
FGRAFHPTTPAERLQMYQQLGERLKEVDKISYDDLKTKVAGISGPVDSKRAVKMAKDFIEKTLEEPKIRTVFASVATLDQNDPKLIALQRLLGINTQNPDDFANAVLSTHLNLAEATDLYANPTQQKLEQFKMNGLLRSTIMTPDELLDLAEKVTGGPLPIATSRDTLISEITTHLVQQGVRRDVLERALQSGLGKAANGGLDVEMTVKEMRVPALIAELKQKTGIDMQGYAELVGVKGNNPDEVIQYLAEGLAGMGIDAPTLHGILLSIPANADPEQIQAILQPVLLPKVMGQFAGTDYDYIRSQIGLKVFGLPAPAAHIPPNPISQTDFVVPAVALGINPFAMQRVLDEIKGRGVKQAGKFVERFNGIVVDAVVRKFADPEAVAKSLGL